MDRIKIMRAQQCLESLFERGLAMMYFLVANVTPHERHLRLADGKRAIARLLGLIAFGVVRCVQPGTFLTFSRGELESFG